MSRDKRANGVVITSKWALTSSLMKHSLRARSVCCSIINVRARSASSVSRVSHSWWRTIIVGNFFSARVTFSCGDAISPTRISICVSSFKTTSEPRKKRNMCRQTLVVARCSNLADRISCFSVRCLSCSIWFGRNWIYWMWRVQSAFGCTSGQISSNRALIIFV